ncbi:hotdog family protein [Pseudidiomarina homiensis]|uniref:Hydroxymyristoyl-ACP dehydratase n=1 Tax=Pseudidiomarina homiensis TaxID=364198 RepID=A0A432XY56_9GAMM|nr:hotdog family protein [Pseudidiomarina homiensis]RUO53650.1 hydroxymyristoyl-ACP dehydratase [Pseudidiomarina homiensis]
MTALTDLIKHRPPMRLIDRFINGDSVETTAHCEVTITTDNLFYRDELGGLPAHVGVELMAQSIAAAAGYRNRGAGEDIKIGFLLGSRKYQCAIDRFPLGETYSIHVAEIHAESSGLSVFQCEIKHHETVVANAKINVFQPPDEAAFIEDTYE